MENNLPFDSVEKLLDELKYLVAKQKNNPSTITQIDIDLTLDKIRKLYDIYLGLNITIIGTESSKVIEKPDPTIHEPEPVVKVNEDEEKDEEKPLPISTTTIDEAEASTKTPEPDTIKDTSLGDTIDLFSDSTTSEKPASQSAIPEQPMDDKKTIGDKISEEQKNESIADKIQKDSIGDLKSAIGINEKFHFINELFDGDMKEYNETIEKLNNSGSLQEGMTSFNLLVNKKDWDNKSDAVSQLKGFIERKYK